jgi:hypothetical protein
MLGEGIPGGGLPAGAARYLHCSAVNTCVSTRALHLLHFSPPRSRSSMTNLGTESNPVWGWAGAEQVNASMAAVSRVWLPLQAISSLSRPPMSRA